MLPGQNRSKKEGLFSPDISFYEDPGFSVGRYFSVEDFIEDILSERVPERSTLINALSEKMIDPIDPEKKLLMKEALYSLSEEAKIVLKAILYSPDDLLKDSGINISRKKITKMLRGLGMKFKSIPYVFDELKKTYSYISSI